MLRCLEIAFCRTRLWIGSKGVHNGVSSMSFGITHLGSGSRGNATLISSEECNILVDCGFSLKQTEKRLGIAGVQPDSIDSIVVTHHHKDHSGSALGASKKWGSSLHCNMGTAIRMGWRPIEECVRHLGILSG